MMKQQILLMLRALPTRCQCEYQGSSQRSRLPFRRPLLLVWEPGLVQCHTPDGAAGRLACSSFVGSIQLLKSFRDTIVSYAQFDTIRYDMDPGKNKKQVLSI